MMIAKELITWGAKLVFDAVQDENNNLDAKQAKGFSKQAMDGISEEAKKSYFASPSKASEIMMYPVKIPLQKKHVPGKKPVR